MSKRVVCSFDRDEIEGYLNGGIPTEILGWNPDDRVPEGVVESILLRILGGVEVSRFWADETPSRTLLKLQADSIEDLWAKLKTLRPDADLQTWLIHEPGEEDAPRPLLEIEEWISEDLANGPGLQMPGRSATFEFYVLSPMPANFGFTEAAARERVTGNWHNLLECLECDGKATMRELHVEKALELLAFELTEASVGVFQEECLLRLTVSPDELERLASL